MTDAEMASTAQVIEVETPVGQGRVTFSAGQGGGLVVLGHGAGGLTWSTDIRAVMARAQSVGWATALIDQPWRLAGRKVAERPARLDLAWVPLVAASRLLWPDGPLVVGGRSAGARVACRTFAEVAADAVLALSFPLHPPGRPEASRAAELALPVDAGRGVLVVQGERDPFGSPSEVRAAVPALGAHVVGVPGTHSLARTDPVVAVVEEWLGQLTAQGD